MSRILNCGERKKYYKDMEEQRFDLMNPQNEEISPYDPSYPLALLNNGIGNELSKAQAAADKVYRAVIRELPELTQVQQSLQKGCRYVVDATDSTIAAIERGALKLTQENGKTYAQLKMNGKYGSKLPIKKEVFRKGIDPTQMANALQMQALQDQLQEVSNQLLVITDRVREVVQGQQNDRIGLYYSGLSLFLESKDMVESPLKTALQAQALRALSEATFQLQLDMKSNIKYLENKDFMSAKKQQTRMIAEHMDSINQSFGFIHQSYMLRAGIYCSLGEMASMARVLDEYSFFIENDVSKNAVLLSQYDTHDDGTKLGLWASRSQLKLETGDMTKLLSNPSKTLYINVAQEE